MNETGETNKKITMLEASYWVLFPQGSSIFVEESSIDDSGGL